MSDIDALRDAKPAGGGLFLSEFPAKIRVLTLDPRLSRDNYGNTRYAFVVWCYDDNKPHILNKGPSFYNRFIEIHNDDDFGANLRRIDVKITVSGKGKETRYTITPVGQPGDLSNELIKEAAEINLDAVIKNGVRLSEVNNGKKVPSSDIEPGQSDEDYPESDEPTNPEDIPF